MVPTVYVHLSGPCSVILPPLWVHVPITATLNSTICVFFLLCLAFATTHPTLCPPLLIYTGAILMNFMIKVIKNWQKRAIVYLPG